MSHSIRPLQTDDLDALSRFLTTGLKAEPGADFAAPEVLRWKYFAATTCAEDGPTPSPRSYVAVDDAGAIVGHVGICLTAFESATIPSADGRVHALHMIDWLGSPTHPGVGASLMRKAHQTAPVQFGLGGSAAGRSVIKRGGYEPMPQVSVYHRLLRPARWLWRGGGVSPSQAARRARDVARHVVNRPKPPALPLDLQPVASFGPEVAEVVAQARKEAVLTTRSAARLDDYLRFPRQAPSGFVFRDASQRPRGFALLNLVPRTNSNGGIVMGKVVDCLLDSIDPDLWHASLLHLSRELARQGADVVETYASTPWMAEGLRRSGFLNRYSLEFSLRDRKGLIPRGLPFHLTSIEADYGYT